MRAPVDKALVLFKITVSFKDGSKTEARAEGNNAAWDCKCDNHPPLIGRCYYQFNDTCYTVCPDCGRKYRVSRDAKKRSDAVTEI